MPKTQRITLKLRGGGEIRLRGVESISWEIDRGTAQLTSLKWKIARSPILNRNPMLHYVNPTAVEAIIEEA